MRDKKIQEPSTERGPTVRKHEQQIIYSHGHNIKNYANSFLYTEAENKKKSNL